MATQITQRFRSSYRSTVLAKLQNFRRRSVWAYLLAALLLAAARPHLLGNFWLTAGGSFAGFWALGIGVLYLGAYVQRHLLLFSAEVTFQENQMLVRPDAPGQPTETHDWRWVLAWQESGTHFFCAFGVGPGCFC